MTDHREALAKLMRRPQEEIDLAYAALLIARERYPDLDIDAYVAKLDELAEAIRAKLKPSASPPKILEAMNAHLFEDLGFYGNADEYYDPANSFLNEVIDRRTGIPITLSVVYMEVAKRMGLELRGVGLPGHFLVKYARREGEVVIDPFGGGAVLSARELRERITHGGGSPELASRYLAAVTKRQIVTRMLNNLKQIYVSSRAFDDALGIIELILAVNPWDLDEIRDRGLVHAQRNAYAEALRDLETYVQYRPEAEDAAHVWENIQALRPRVPGQE